MKKRLQRLKILEIRSAKLKIRKLDLSEIQFSPAVVFLCQTVIFFFASSQVGPYAHKGKLWVGYDDITAVQDKAIYVSEEGLGGIMFWTIDNDDYRGYCHDKPFPLIESAKEALYGKVNAQV